MDNYVIVEDSPPKFVCPFPEPLMKDVLRFELKKNSKFDGILSRVEREFSNGARNVIFHGSGEACAKCIACVEVLKKNHKEKVPEGDHTLYQWNAVSYTTTKDIWGSATEEHKQLDRLVVEKSVPTISILISRDQFSGQYKCASQQTSSDKMPPSFPVIPPTSGDGQQLNQQKKRYPETWRRKKDWQSNNHTQRGPPRGGGWHRPTLGVDASSVEGSQVSQSTSGMDKDMALDEGQQQQPRQNPWRRPLRRGDQQQPRRRQQHQQQEQQSIGGGSSPSQNSNKYNNLGDGKKEGSQEGQSRQNQQQKQPRNKRRSDT